MGDICRGYIGIMERKVETVGIIIDGEFDHHSWRTRFAYKPYVGLAKLRSGP